MEGGAPFGFDGYRVRRYTLHDSLSLTVSFATHTVVAGSGWLPASAEDQQE